MNKREEYIQKLKTCLVGQSVNYILKSPDMLFYDFGFGEDIVLPSRLFDSQRTVAAYALHAQCYIKVMWKKSTGRKVDWLIEDTPTEAVKDLENYLKGMPIQNVDLNEANDFWLDFGNCWVVLVTTDDNIESWRFFTFLTPNANHLVATNENLSEE